MKNWESEEEMNARLRRITREMRKIREELRGYMPGPRNRDPALPTEDERRIRSIANDKPKK